jgi:hypothetical protein
MVPVSPTGTSASLPNVGGNMQKLVTALHKQSLTRIGSNDLPSKGNNKIRPK